MACDLSSIPPCHPTVPTQRRRKGGSRALGEPPSLVCFFNLFQVFFSNFTNLLLVNYYYYSFNGTTTTKTKMTAVGHHRDFDRSSQQQGKGASESGMVFSLFFSNFTNLYLLLTTAFNEARVVVESEAGLTKSDQMIYVEICETRHIIIS
jgi:hypothetical protein